MNEREINIHSDIKCKKKTSLICTTIKQLFLWKTHFWRTRIGNITFWISGNEHFHSLWDTDRQKVYCESHSLHSLYKIYYSFIGCDSHALWKIICLCDENCVNENVKRTDNTRQTHPHCDENQRLKSRE